MKIVGAVTFLLLIAIGGIVMASVLNRDDSIASRLRSLSVDKVSAEAPVSRDYFFVLVEGSGTSLVIKISKQSADAAPSVVLVSFNGEKIDVPLARDAELRQAIVASLELAISKKSLSAYSRQCARNLISFVEKQDK